MNPYGRYPKRRIYVADLISLVAASFTALVIRYDSLPEIFDRLYIALIISMCLIQTVIFVVVDLRRRSIFEADPFENLMSVIRDRTIVMVMTVIYLYATQQGEVSSRFVIFAIYALSILYEFILRMMVRKSYLKKHPCGDGAAVLELRYPYPDADELGRMVAESSSQNVSQGGRRAGVPGACEILVHGSGASDEEL